MIWFFIPLLIGTGFTLFYIYDDIFPYPTIEEIFSSIVLFIFFEFLTIIFSIAVYIGCGSIVGLFFEPVSYTQTETPLIALKDNSTINGSFFLGCGNVDSKTQYSYAVDTEFGIEIKTLPTDKKIYFKYDEGAPALITSKPVYSTLAEWLSAPCYDPIYTFRIPEGSIINEYKVDLEWKGGVYYLIYGGEYNYGEPYEVEDYFVEENEDDTGIIVFSQETIEDYDLDRFFI